jgi:hypothetical protein
MNDMFDLMDLAMMTAAEFDGKKCVSYRKLNFPPKQTITFTLEILNPPSKEEVQSLCNKIVTMINDSIHEKPHDAWLTKYEMHEVEDNND